MPIPRAFDVDMVFRGHGWLSTRSKPSDPHLVLWIYVHIERDLPSCVYDVAELLSLGKMCVDGSIMARAGCRLIWVAFACAASLSPNGLELPQYARL